MILPLHIPYLKRVVVSLVFLYPMAFPKDKDVSMLCELPTSSDVKHLNSMQFRDLLIRFGNCTAIAQHRRWSRHGGYVTLINATPYDWNLTSMHQNQMEYDFPSLISAGSAHEQYINFIKDHADGTAEAVYTLVDTPSAASFSVQAKHMGDKQVSIQYHDTLSSMNNPVGSKIDLGFQKDGGVSFILSGTSPSFVSSNPPTGWMQNSISSIGSKYLREIAMPASHNSGMNKLTHHYGGVEHNTLTQSLGVYAQAENGARYFDIRPVLHQGKFYAGHFSKLMGKHVGGTGSTILDIVHDINGFNHAFPGELLILDISHDMNIDLNFQRFREQEWQELYRILDGIVDLWVPEASWARDLSAVPLSTFITPRSKSAVIVRLPFRAPLPFPRQEHPVVEVEAEDHSQTSTKISNGLARHEDNGKSKGNEKAKSKDFGFPIPKVAPSSITGVSHDTAFIPDTWLPVVNYYSNTNKPNHLSADQIRKMKSHKSSEDGMFMGVWTLTQHWQHILDIANHKHSIVGDAAQAHRRLFSDLWPAISKDGYPNLIQIDNIHTKEVLALTMAMNNNIARPLRLSRREVSTEEDKPKSATPNSQKPNCSFFDRLAHLWRLYPKEECYSPHPFQSLAKNAQELAREWEFNERANAHARANDTAAMLKDEEEWRIRQAAKSKAKNVGTSDAQPTAVEAAYSTAIEAQITATKEIDMNTAYRGMSFRRE